MDAQDPSQGYVTDTNYKDTFFRELSPVWLNYVAMLRGADARSLDQPFSYLELGCGYGNSTIVNAGAFPKGDFHACDVNPAHIAGAERQAAALDLHNIHFYQAPFADLHAFDLPLFDFIVVHGVYSWVAAETRRTIREIVHKKLKPAGLLYLSYNSQPGWSSEVPLRKLLFELTTAEPGNTSHRAEYALRALQALSRGELRYFKTNPAALAALDSYSKGSSHYLVHEFLNQAWEPFYSVDIAEEMAEIGLSYLGSATLADNHPELVIPATAAEAIARLETSRLQQLAIDFAVDRRFRRDVFVRSGAKPDPAGITRHLETAIIGCFSGPEHIRSRVRVPRGIITFRDDFIHDLQQLMTHTSLTLAEMVAALGGDRKNAREIIRNLTFLVAAGVLAPFAKAHRRKDSTETARPANAMLARALASIAGQHTLCAVPSEILGNGVPMTPIEAMAVLEARSGTWDVTALASRLEAKMQPADGNPLDVADRVIRVLIPTLARLGLIP